MKSVGCLAARRKFASRWKTRVALPSFPVTLPLDELVIQHCGRRRSRHDVAAAGAPDTYLHREAPSPLSIGPDSVERVDLQPRQAVNESDRAGFVLLSFGQPFRFG
jgi:hypothetical protein